MNFQKTLKIGTQKQGVEMTLTTMIQFIIAAIVFIVIILFFTGQFSSNSTAVSDISNAGIEAAKNFSGN